MKAMIEVEEVMNNYNMGFITNNERYNQIIDIWTHTNCQAYQYGDEPACQPTNRDSIRFI